MGTLLRAVMVGFGLSIAMGAATAAGDLSALEAGQYSVEVRGSVEATAHGLTADDKDAAISNQEMRDRAAQERLLFTGDTFYKPESGESGPFEISMTLGPDYTSIEGADAPGVVVSLHFAEGLEPGTYPVSDGLLDVGPNRAPVAVLVAAASKDRKQTFAYGWKVIGEVTIEQLDREQATGTFEFAANAMNRKGQVTDDRIQVRGAFKQVPFTPEASLAE
ncbi:hypothetical protein H0Z60_16110 [Ectothiorhodospiraceae bacterium WFHF3C12]|nr:hypothetical protein [Ectothiorhodospiraceae bacterium WFHF3C12]